MGAAAFRYFEPWESVGNALSGLALYGNPVECCPGKLTVHSQDTGMRIEIVAPHSVHWGAVDIVARAVSLFFASVDPTLWTHAPCRGVRIDIAPGALLVTDLPYWRAHLAGRHTSAGRSFTKMSAVSSPYPDSRGFARCVLREHLLLTPHHRDPAWPVLHELGHIMFFYCIPREDWRPGGFLDRLYWKRLIHEEAYPSRYAAQNPQEYQAEAVAIYLLARSGSRWIMEHDVPLATYLAKLFPERRIAHAHAAVTGRLVA